MGIGQKIKDALSTENEREPRDDQLPGEYPEDEYAQKHSDGRTHIPPHGTAVGDEYGTSTSGLSGREQYPAGHHEREAGLGHHGRDHRQGGIGTDESTIPHPSSQHKTLRSEDPVAINEAYTRTGEQQQQYDTRGHHGHHGAGTGLDPTRRHQEREGVTSSEEPYWGDANRTGHHQTGHHAAGHRAGGAHGREHIPGGSAALATKELPEHPRGAHHTTGRDDLPPPTGPAVGGGVYNTVTGTGSHEDALNRSDRAADSRHNPLESGATGVGGSGISGQPYGQTVGSQGVIPPNEQTGAGHGGFGHTGHAGTGTGYTGTGRNEVGHSGPGHTGAGVAAGLAGSEAVHKHHKHQQPGYGQESGRFQDQAGVPQSSMLDPQLTEPHARKPVATDPLRSSNEQTSQVGRSDISGPGAGGAGMGGQYRGPGHEGAKVVHKCHNCGVDNDISHYFHKGAVYRIGS